MTVIRKIARIASLPILGSERRKKARADIEAFLHKMLKTEHYLCEREYQQCCTLNRSLGFDKYHLISLGYNCFGRMTFNYWSLKPRKAEGEKTMPFDITQHPLPTVVKLLSTRFAGYLDNAIYNHEKQYWIDTSLDVLFVHDHEPDKQILTDRYQTRIANFYAAVEDNLPCLFFAYADSDVAAEDINALYAELQKLCRHKDFKLVYMIFNHNLPSGVNDAVALYHADYPQGYVHMDKFTKYKRAGLGFEKGVADFVREQIAVLIKNRQK